jgi:hypothetical protein
MICLHLYLLVTFIEGSIFLEDHFLFILFFMLSYKYENPAFVLLNPVTAISLVFVPKLETPYLKS